MANVEKSYRELVIERNVAWATKEKLNPKAIKYAKESVNVDRALLALISDYENAVDLPAGDIREKRLREAWDNTLRHIRSLIAASAIKQAS